MPISPGTKPRSRYTVGRQRRVERALVLVNLRQQIVRLDTQRVVRQRLLAVRFRAGPITAIGALPPEPDQRRDLGAGDEA